MNDDDRTPPPAAIASILFASGIALASVVADGWLTAAGLTCCAFLAATLGGGRRFAVLLAFLTAGLAVGLGAAGERREETARLEATPQSAFTTMLVPFERAWERDEDSSRLRARSFAIEDNVGEIAIDRSLSVTLWDEPPAGEHGARWRLEGFLECEGSRCRASVKSARLVEEEGTLPRWHPARWNRAANARLHALSRSSELARRGAAQAAALALGRGEMLDDEVREAYRRGGTYHLLVFSGMQIAFAAGIVNAVFRRLGRPRPGDWILLAMAVIAPPFAGNDPSVARSATMIGIFACSRIIARPTSIENLLFVSAMVRLALHPGELTEPGFALTFAATGSLIVLGRRFASPFRNRIARAFAFGAGAEIATAPVTAYFFHQVIVASSIVTLLLSPLLTAMLALSFGACVVSFVHSGLAVLLLETIGRLDAVAVAANLFVGDVFRTSVFIAAPPAEAVAVAFIVASAALGTRLRGSGSIAVVALLFPLALSLIAELRERRVDAFQVELLDVGQGDAILIREGLRTMLIDGGGWRNDDSFARAVLIPMLIDRGVRRIDTLVATHPDPDHCGGLPLLVERLGSGAVWISSRHLASRCGGDLFDAARKRGVPLVLADRALARTTAQTESDSWGVRVWAADPPFRKSFTNNTSLVLRLEKDGWSFLFTGDIEGPAELELLESVPDFLPIDVLKVAHHGSRTSTSPTFLRAARPRLALISAGRRNRYGHPAPEVLQRLKQGGIRVLRTDLQGGVRLRIDRGHLFSSAEIDTTAKAGSL